MTTEKFLLADPSIGRTTSACGQCVQRSVEEPSYNNIKHIIRMHTCINYVRITFVLYLFS
jgi:hypothetical protein